MKNRDAAVLAVLILFAFQIGTWSAPTVVPQSAVSIVKVATDHGFGLLQTGDYTAAKAEFMKALQIDKHNPRAMVGLAYCYGNTDAWGMARTELESAVLFNPRDGFVLVNYLNISSHVGQLDKGIVLVRSLLNTSDRSAAKPSYQVAKFLVEIDYWSAQWFAQKANSLDAKAYPSSEVRQEALHITLPPPVTQQATQPQPTQQAPKTQQGQQAQQPSGTSTNPQQQPGSAANPPDDSQNYPAYPPAYQLGNTAVLLDTGFNNPYYSGYGSIPTDTPSVSYIPPNGTLNIVNSNFSSTFGNTVPYGGRFMNVVPFGLPFSNGVSILQTNPFVGGYAQLENNQPYRGYSNSNY